MTQDDFYKQWEEEFVLLSRRTALLAATVVGLFAMFALPYFSSINTTANPYVHQQCSTSRSFLGLVKRHVCYVSTSVNIDTPISALRGFRTPTTSSSHSRLSTAYRLMYFFYTVGCVYGLMRFRYRSVVLEMITYFVPLLAWVPLGIVLNVGDSSGVGSFLLLLVLVTPAAVFVRCSFAGERHRIITACLLEENSYGKAGTKADFQQAVIELAERAATSRMLLSAGKSLLRAD